MNALLAGLLILVGLVALGYGLVLFASPAAFIAVGLLLVLIGYGVRAETKDGPA